MGRTGRAGSNGVAISLCDNYGLKKLNEIRPSLNIENIEDLKSDKNFYLQGEYSTLRIDGGKKKKLRAGDILGTLCKDIGLDSKDISKINHL